MAEIEFSSPTEEVLSSFTQISSMEQSGKEPIQAQNSSLQSTGRLKRNRASAYATPSVDEKGRETLICNFCQSVIRAGETSKDVEEEKEIPLRNVKRGTRRGPRADINVADLSTEDKLLLQTAKEALKKIFSARKTEAFEIFKTITNFKA